MQTVLQEGPNDISNEKAQDGLDEGMEWHGGDCSQWKGWVYDEWRERHGELKERSKVEVRGYWEPEYWDHVPDRSRSHL